ncbi:MAG: extracellular solute-binding protein [Anaerolineaceae bacterium]|nr:extracellular solute-binding protein [Anaerolineaceae bacterium]
MRSKSLILTLVFLTSLTLGGLTSAQEPMTLTVMRFFGDCQDEYGDSIDLTGITGECGIITTLTNLWNEQNPDIQVETIVAEWPGTTQLNAAIAAGTPPDITVLHGRRIPIYASRGALTPMTAAFSEAGIDLGDLTAGAADYGIYEGEYYGLPYDLAATIWHINLDLWAEAGLVDDNGAPVLPGNREEFLATGRQIYEATGLPFADMPGQAATVRPLTAFIYQQGGSLADEEGNPTVNTEEALNALNFLLEIQASGFVTTPYSDISGAIGIEKFSGGESAGVIDGTWRINVFDGMVAGGEVALKNYYVANFPQIFDQPGTFAGSHNWLVPLGPDADPERVAAAAQFIKWLSDNSVVWARVGHGMTRTSVLASEEFLNLPHRSEYAAMSETVRSVPRETWGNAFWGIVHEEVEAALLGVKTPEVALADAQTRLEEFELFQ